MNNLNTELPMFCPRENCEHFKSADNKIIKYGTYTTKGDPEPRQMFYCEGGDHKFSETAYSDLWGKHGSFKEYEQTAKLKCYGLNDIQIADVLEKDERTIAAWTEPMAVKSKQFHLWLCTTIGLIISFLQRDELWSYISKKTEQYWVFASIDVTTRFWIGFECGKRTTKTAKLLVKQVYKLGKWSNHRILKITTDKLKAYQNAIEFYFTDIKYVYLQIVKKRVRRILKTVKKAFIKGDYSGFPDKTQNTSYIERFNLTLRQKVAYLARKTLGYCKKIENFNDSLSINLFNYNYCCFHKSLRVRLPGRPSNKKFIKQYRGCTPAMKMNLTNAPLTWRFLFTAPVP